MVTVNRRGDYFNAKKYAETNLSYQTTQNNKFKIASLYNFIGMIYCDISMYDDASIYLNKAIDTNPKSVDLKSKIIHNIGLTCKRNNNFDGALSYFKQALQLKEQNQLPNQLITHFKIIECYVALDRPVLAKQQLQLSSTLLTTEFDYYRNKSLQGDIALLNDKKAEYITSKREAYAYFEDYNMVKYAKKIALELGEIYYSLNQYKEATKFYRKYVKFSEQSLSKITF